ncbi:MAG TPA: hypothetical protein V6D03_08630, partial [Candidatus Caenarcaniphilales bacterium]
MKWLKVVFVGVLISLLMAPSFAWGAPALTPQEATTKLQQTELTPQLLQERLRSPILLEGIRTIDLRRLVIDLRPEKAALRDQFYQ